MKKEKDRKDFSLYERNGVYYVRLYDPARRAYTAARTTGETDRDKAAIRAAEMIKAGQIVKKEDDPLFIESLLTYWQGRSDPSQKYKEETLRRINNTIASSLHFQNIRMSKISAPIVNRFKEDLKQTNTPRAINRTLQIIKTFIRWSFELGYISTDFSRQIKQVDEPKARRGFLEPDEVIKLAALEWPDLRIKAAVTLALFAGLRKGEIRALRWTHINFEKLTISVEENFTDEYDESGEPIFKKPKYESNRRFPYLIFPELKTVLSRLYTETPYNKPDDLVLCNVWGSLKKNQNPAREYAPMSTSAFKRDFSRMLSAVGISDEEQARRKLVFHSLRHSFTSLLSAVAPASSVMGLTGHESAAAYNGYRHTVTSAAQQALESATAFLDQYRTGERVNIDIPTDDRLN